MPRELLASPIDPEKRDAFAAEVADTNRRRATVLLPLMTLVHGIHVAVFRLSLAERASLPPRLVAWRLGLVWTHGITMVVVAALSVAVFRFGRTRAARWLGPVTAVVYLVHGAVIAGVDQLAVGGVTPFVAYSLASAVIMCLTPIDTVVAYAVGLAAFVPSIVLMQGSTSARLAALPSGVTVTVVCVALSWMLHLARRRDFAQRVTIEAQRAKLAELNAGLERRVQEQIGEIVERARKVEELNAQLHASVRARSAELSIALAQLAQRNHGGMLQRGVVLGDRFEIEDMIGAGGMGSVYRGLDRTNGTRVAIKVIQANSTQHLDSLNRFIREAGTAAKVDHAAVVRMIHVDVSSDGLLYHAQELVEGDTLQRRLQRGLRWAPGTAARLVSMLAEALAAAHAVGVVHRDVKPSNVMITPAAPGLRLLDFGISKLYGDEEGGEDRTRTGIVLGTPSYMAPEQMGGPGRVTDRADVYAVGVLLFVLLTGRLPFTEGTPGEIAAGVLLREAPDVRSLAPDVPPRVSSLVARCLARSAEMRPAARSLAGELAAIADAEGVGAIETLEQAGALRGEGSTLNYRETVVEARI